MNYTQIVQLCQSIIDAVQNGAVFIGKQIQALSRRTLSVHVTNPQSKVVVSGKVEVDQSRTENQLKNNALAIRELRAVIKTLKKIEVSNFPKPQPFPKFPVFPKSFRVENPQKEVAISNMKEFIGAVEKVEKALSSLKMSPEIKVDAPQVNIPAPIVNVPKQEAPVVNVEAPDLSDLTKIIEFLNKIGPKSPLAVRLSDGQKFYNALQKMADIYAGSTFHAFQTADGSEGRAMLNKNNELRVTASDTWALNDNHQVGSNTYLGEENVDGEWRITKATTSGNFVTMRYATKKNNEGVTNYTEAWDDHESLSYGRISETL